MLECRARSFLGRIGLATALAVAAPVATSAHDALTAAGTEFVLTTVGGRTLRSGDLVGATLSIAIAGKQVEITIQSVEEDRHAVGGHVLLHHFLIKNEADRQIEMCTPDAEGRSLGFPVPDGHGGFD